MSNGFNNHRKKHQKPKVGSFYRKHVKFVHYHFDYFSISDWFSFVLYIVLFVAIVFFMVKCGTWAYERNEASSLMVKRFLAILGGLILVAFVIIWDDVVVPYFAQNIAT